MVPWCAGEDAVFHCPCGPNEAFYGYKPTCWGVWPTSGAEWRDIHCGPLKRDHCVPCYNNDAYIEHSGEHQPVDQLPIFSGPGKPYPENKYPEEIPTYVAPQDEAQPTLETPQPQFDAPFEQVNPGEAEPDAAGPRVYRPDNPNAGLQHPQATAVADVEITDEQPATEIAVMVTTDDSNAVDLTSWLNQQENAAVAHTAEYVAAEELPAQANSTVELVTTTPSTSRQSAPSEIKVVEQQPQQRQSQRISPTSPTTSPRQRSMPATFIR